MSRRLLAGTLVATILGVMTVAPPAPARADDDPPQRAVPDYDGRGEEPTEAGDVALWIPRILFSPFYVITEYGVRRPIGYAMNSADPRSSGNQPSRPTPGFFPTFSADVGMRPRVGLYFYWDELLHRSNDFQLHLNTWGYNSLQALLVDRVAIMEDRAWVALTLDAEKRDDFIFAGIGPRSDDDDVSRYQSYRGETRLALELLPSRRLRVVAWVGTRAVRYDDEGCCDDPTVMERVGNGDFARPPGFESGYSAWVQGAELVIDTRRVRPDPGSGVRVAVRGEHAIDYGAPEPSQWLRYSGSLSGIVDLTGTRRELSLTLDAAFADPVAGDIVPFTELATLGGNAPLPAFLPGRLMDRSAAAATLAYAWPIWTWLDAQLHVAAGNVFGAHLAGLDPELARLSFGVGLADRNPDGYLFRTLFAVGTDTIEDGATPRTVRFLFEVGHEL